MLDHRVYRAAFLPALVALFVVAFSLTDPGPTRTTRLAPEAFDGRAVFGRAATPPRNSLRELGASFRDRRPGSPADVALAGRVAEVFRATGFGGTAGVERSVSTADTIDGEKDLVDVVAVRQGLSAQQIVVVAHRDTPSAGPALAELSGTAVLLELARLLAERDLRKTVVLASVSGGSGGFAGARRVAQDLDGPVDAVFVLGDLASRDTRRPFVVPWANGQRPAPYALGRTAAAALRAELTGDPGHDRPIPQWLRRAMPLTLGGQGPVGEEGLPAVLISASGELRPAGDAPVSAARLTAFGRGVLRTLTASLEAGGIETDPVRRAGVPAFPGGDGVVARGRLIPDWAVRGLVGALLLPALLASLDAFFRARRRGLPVGRWLAWAVTFALPLLVAWGWARALDAVGGVTALGAPVTGRELPVATSGWVAMASSLVLALGVALLVRPALVRRIGPRGDAAAGGAAAATGLGLCTLVAGVWVLNPYAAAILVPAAHAWVLATAPRSPSRRVVTAVAVLVGLLAPALVVLYYVQTWDLGPLDAVWSLFNLVAGGVLGVLDALALTGFAAAFCATVAVLRARGRLRRSAGAQEEKIVTRGPRSYAGPGSLGGTESALRR